MALDFAFESASTMEPRQVPTFLGSKYTQVAEGRFVAPALTVSVLVETHRGQTMIKEGFGFVPNFSVSFRLDPNAEDQVYLEAKQTMIQAVTDLLQRDTSDAVLLFNGEHILLQRIGGQLVLNSAWSEWDTYYLKAYVLLPYNVRSLPSPLL